MALQALVEDLHILRSQSRPIVTAFLFATNTISPVSQYPFCKGEFVNMKNFYTAAGIFATLVSRAQANKDFITLQTSGNAYIK